MLQLQDCEYYLLKTSAFIILCYQVQLCFCCLVKMSVQKKKKISAGVSDFALRLIFEPHLNTPGVLACDLPNACLHPGSKPKCFDRIFVICDHCCIMEVNRHTNFHVYTNTTIEAKTFATYQIYMNQVEIFHKM